MKSKVLLLAGLVMILSLVVAVAGCNSGSAASSTAAPPAVTPPPSFISPPAVSSPFSVNVNSQQGIWVNGTGTVVVTPDIANLSLGVSEQAARVADAQAQAAVDMDKVMSALSAKGIDKKDISTQNYNIFQLTRYDNNSQQSIVTGYQVSNTVNVKIRAIASTGAVIDAVAAAAGDAARINGISFSVDDPTQYYSQVRTMAVNDAKNKAAQLASLAGVTLGKPLYISENSPGTTVPYVPAPTLAGAGQGVTTPVSPGQTNITLNIQVAYSVQ
jgi:uncharacterized protein